MTDIVKSLPVTKDDNFNVDAAPKEDVRVDIKKAENVLSIYHDFQDDSNEPISAEQKAVLMHWLGKSFVSRLRNTDARLVYKALMSLPKPAEKHSFVWNIISGPKSIRKALQAISDVKSFDNQTVVISDKIGANNDFREAIVHFGEGKDVMLRKIIGKIRENVAGLRSFVDRIEYLRGRVETMFKVDDLTVEAFLCIFAAAPSIVASERFINESVSISKYPQGDILSKLESIRGKVVEASNRVKAICGVAPILFSETALSGAVRSVKHMRPGDFVYVIEALGGALEGDENIENAIQAFVEYIESYNKMKSEIIDWGYGEDEIPALISYALIQRHLKAAAEELDIDFSRVEFFFRLNMPIDAKDEDKKNYRDDLMQFFKEIEKDGVSGRLMAICGDKQSMMSKVYSIIYKATVEREYLLQVGQRIVDVYTEVTVGEVIDVISREDDLRKANEEIRKFGVHTPDDLAKLEAHVDWSIAANSLPVPSEAIVKLVELRGQVQA